MDLSELSKPLTVDQIDFRVQSINKGGYATILAYKDARVDMMRLNEVCGVLGWKREHSRENQNCTVSLWNDKTCQWVGKEDTGTQSNTEAQKGLASDSFKRSCFNLGIGIELYDYPILSIKLNSGEWKLNENKKDKWGNPKPEATYNFKLKEWTWFTQFDGNELICIAAKDEKGKVRFKWGEYNQEKVVSPILAAYENSEAIMAIKKAIADGDNESMRTIYKEFTPEETDALWVSKTKGGVWTVEEYNYLKLNMGEK